MDNMELYEKVRTVPDTAKRTIEAGRLKGKTDINPMWRIKTLTEQFGPCGRGWFYQITNKRFELVAATSEVAAFVDIELYVKFGEEWSKPILGTGGSMFVSVEKNGLHISDECFKMALTDAISVACKALGIGADVYWERDTGKYTKNDTGNASPAKASVKKTTIQKPSDVFNIPGAGEADRTTLYVNALNIAGIDMNKGRSIIDEMFGEDTLMKDLSDEQFKKLIQKLDEIAEESNGTT